MTKQASSTDSFWDDTSGAGALKAGFLGFAGSGKSTTAALLAVAAREVLGLKGPVAMYDTEMGSVYLRPAIEKLTGKPFLVKRDRSFVGLMGFAGALEKADAAVGIVDSITHPWRELCSAYLAERNEAGRKKLGTNWKERTSLQFDDWSVIKDRWGEWADFYLNSSRSLVICGRAGWDYEMEVDEETGKKQLNKTGVKMKTEGEFGFEPSLLMEMEQVQDLAANAKTPTITRRATVLKDRFSVLDGKSIEFGSLDLTSKDLKAAYEQVLKFFGPHLSLLVPGAKPKVDTNLKSSFGIDGSGEAALAREQREREVLIEEIKNDLSLAHPGTHDAAKNEKVKLLRAHFGTGAWAKVETFSAEKLREGRESLLAVLGKARAAEAPAPTSAPTPAAPEAVVPVTTPSVPAAAPAPTKQPFDFA